MTITCTCIILILYNNALLDRTVHWLHGYTLQSVGGQFYCQVIRALQVTVKYQVLQLQVVQVPKLLEKVIDDMKLGLLLQ